jgi:hypothetical protein
MRDLVKVATTILSYKMVFVHVINVLLSVSGVTEQKYLLCDINFVSLTMNYQYVVLH